MSALDELRHAYRDRFEQPSEIGYVGSDVPRELIEAHGVVPLRLAPIPGVPTSFADSVLGPGVDEAIRAVLAGLLEGVYPIDRVVLCHDSDHTVRLYTALRQLDGIDLDLWFVDLLHLRRPASATYNRRQLAEFSTWLGGDVDPSPVIAAANRARTAGVRLAALRRNGGVAGADALAALGAGTALPAARYAELLNDAVAELERNAGATARKVFMHGSDHYDAAVYDAIDGLGAVVVGESHGWGERLLEGRIDEIQDPLIALGQHYARELQPRNSADLELAWIRPGDESKLWALPNVSVARSIAELREVVG